MRKVLWYWVDRKDLALWSALPITAIFIYIAVIE